MKTEVMAKSKAQLRSVEMPIVDWNRLDQVAEATGSVAKRGPRAGQPSWRVLVKRIARNELLVGEKPDPGTQTS